MSRLAVSFSIIVVIATLAGGAAFAQMGTSDKAKTDQTVQKKMKNSEDPSSPAAQQAAAKQAECKKQAKAKKLTGAERKAFMNDCTK
jgi:uncharacterized protein HemX